MGVQQTHGAYAGEGCMGAATEAKPEPCDCFGCTQRRLFYCDEAEAKLTTPLPRQNSPSSWKLH